MSSNERSISEILQELPSRFRGPGGAVAVVQDGKLVGQQVWGYADLQRRIPMAPDTVIPICSISKQMLCGLLRSLQQEPTQAMIAQGGDPAKLLSDQLKEFLQPEMVNNTGLSLDHLCNNQSGIRDYWAMTVLWGAMPDGHFGIIEHGPQMLERLQSFHFQPGTQYSYANTNFFIVARIIEKVTQQPLKDLLTERIFAPAGMKSAFLCADTSTHPAPCVGYEGDENFGFYPGINRIEWAGDAGIVASLTDMVAYEQYLDSNRENPQSWYHYTSQQQSYKDGTLADYGHGLARHKVGDIMTVRHGGALRGYRLSRLYAPEKRMSVIALLNQEHGDAGEVSDYVLKQAYSVKEVTPKTVEAGAGWVGTYLDDESQLAITVALGTPGQILLKYHRKPEKLRLVEPHRAESDGTVVTLDGDVLHLNFPADNRKFQAKRVKSEIAVSKLAEDLVGHYYCSEMDSHFDCDGSGSMVYATFKGFLGSGPVHLMRPLADDIWALACPRAMDSTPPGDWTIVANRSDGGRVSTLTIGCWLARNLVFHRRDL